jgi:hypothetical protein
VGGAAQGVLNVRDAAQLPVPLVGQDAQERWEQELLARLTKTTHLTTTLDNSIRCMSERRQALIIAAVTGQLDLAREIAEGAS